MAVAWSDAALANRVELGSAGSMLIGLVHRDKVDKGLKGRSSLAAETQALAEAEQELTFVGPCGWRCWARR